MEEEKFKLGEKIEEWFNTLFKIKDTEVRQIYRINKRELDNIIKIAERKLNQ